MSAQGDLARIQCPHCRAIFKVRASLIGKSGPCPKCKKAFTITKEIILADSNVTEDAQVRQVEPQELPGFASAAFGYSLTTPTAGWVRAPREDESAHQADLLIQHPDIGLVKVMTSDGETDFEALYSELEEVCASEVKQFRLLAKQKSVIAGLPAASIEYEGTPPESDKLKVMRHVFLKDDHVFQIIGMAPPITFPRLKKEMAQMVASFSFDPQIGTTRRGNVPREIGGVPPLERGTQSGRVIANWQRKGTWFLGDIVQRSGQKILVRYVDGDAEWCDADQVRDPAPIKGLRVFAQSHGQQPWLPGVIRDVRTETITVEFFAGHVETVPLSAVRPDDLGAGDTILTCDAQQRSLQGTVRKRERDGCLCDFVSGGSDVVPIQSLALLRKDSGQDNAWASPARSPGQVIRIGSPRHPWLFNSAVVIAADLREHCGAGNSSLVKIETWSRRTIVIGFTVFGIAAPLNLGLLGLPAVGGALLLMIIVFPAMLKDIFREHLRRELKCEKADPDNPKDDSMQRPVDYFRGGPMIPLQEAMNRHWAYHARQAAATGVSVETVPTNWMRDLIKPPLVGLAIMAGIAAVLWCVQHVFSFIHGVVAH